MGPDAIIKNGKNGYLVEYENVSQLAKQIDLTTHNYHELEHIVQGGRETLELYQPDKVYEDFMSMFR